MESSFVFAMNDHRVATLKNETPKHESLLNKCTGKVRVGSCVDFRLCHERVSTSGCKCVSDDMAQPQVFVSSSIA